MEAVKLEVTKILEENDMFPRYVEAKIAPNGRKVISICCQQDRKRRSGLTSKEWYTKAKQLTEKYANQGYLVQVYRYYSGSY